MWKLVLFFLLPIFIEAGKNRSRSHSHAIVSLMVPSEGKKQTDYTNCLGYYNNDNNNNNKIYLLL